MEDFEKLGAFYLGRVQDLAAGKRTDELVLYDSKDLTTHGVIIGMTGSGKTGLGIGLIEEAAIDRIPVIAIDPKGDLGNLLLTFPELRPADFEPWVSAQEAEAKGLTRRAVRRGAGGDVGEGTGRLGAVRRADQAAAGRRPTSRSTRRAARRERRSRCCAAFTAPPEAIRNDADLFRERLQTTASSVLALLGIDADPITSREHILVSNILQRAWAAGKDLDLPGLIGQIQNPPFEKIGVMEVDQVFPAKDRTALAMQINNLLGGAGLRGVDVRRPARCGSAPLYAVGQAARVGAVDRAPGRRGADVLRLDAAQRADRMDAAAAGHRIAARDPVHGRDLRLPAAGGQPADQDAVPDAAQAGARVRARASCSPPRIRWTSTTRRCRTPARGASGGCRRSGTRHG